MPDYINNLRRSESKRYEGFDKFLQCISQAQIAADDANLRATIAAVAAAVQRLLNQTSLTRLISKILDKSGKKIKESIMDKLKKKLESAVKEKKRPLNDTEVEDKIIEVAKEEAASNDMPDTECIEDNFNVDDFIIEGLKPPPMTPVIKSNLKKLHSTIIVPIMKHYKGSGEIPDDGKCRFKIVAGLVNKFDTITRLKGTTESVHPKGMAIDFYIEDLKTEKVFKDICENKISLEYGVVYNKGNSIHITIPYKKFKKFILSIDTNIDPFTTGFSFAGKLLGKLFN